MLLNFRRFSASRSYKKKSVFVVLLSRLLIWFLFVILKSSAKCLYLYFCPFITTSVLKDDLVHPWHCVHICMCKRFRTLFLLQWRINISCDSVCIQFLSVCPASAYLSSLFCALLSGSPAYSSVSAFILHFFPFCFLIFSVSFLLLPIYITPFLFLWISNCL